MSFVVSQLLGWFLMFEKKKHSDLLRCVRPYASAVPAAAAPHQDAIPAAPALSHAPGAPAAKSGTTNARTLAVHNTKQALCRLPMPVRSRPSTK